eukprot:TRINITY_DN3076_c0_g1_i24.p1 TRINITY_DN3076_c0_g1~~TRINITY_DN3076_c0_g1_i24.p1  ORF type:complete len:131 (-),score=11.89 TRINITY_DN3076_c0_g1_i24:204-596(-)
MMILDYYRPILLFLGMQIVYFGVKGFKIKKESMTIIKELGVLLEKERLNRLKVREFIDISKIKGLIIHEGMTPYDVRYYLAIIIKDSMEVKIPFSGFDLSLNQLLQVYYPSRRFLELDGKMQQCVDAFYS